MKKGRKSRKRGKIRKKSVDEQCQWMTMFFKKGLRNDFKKDINQKKTARE